MKENYKNMMSRVTKGEIIYWWIFRLLMVYALVKGIVGVVNGTNDMSDPLQVFGNLLGMFAWEIFMFFPKKSFVVHFPSIIQDFSIIMIFAASFCGKFLNFYYDVRLWDSGMHLLSGGLCVLLGYEVVVAMQKRDKMKISVPIALFCALCFSFFVSTCWELFEFTADQVMCMGGAKGDAQHWCWELAEGTPKAFTLFPAYYKDRWPLMDTMGDIILNSIGAIVAWIALKIFPYNHKGKRDVNLYLESKTEKAPAYK